MAMTSRIFTLEDQLAFATLSGDNNPLHVDPLAARRLMFGSPVVHGIHLVLWALSECRRGAASQAIGKLDAEFLQPVRINTPVDLEWTDAGGQTRLRVLSEGSVMMKLLVRWTEVTPSLPGPAQRQPAQIDPVDLVLDQVVTGQKARLPLSYDRADLTALFPEIEALMPALQIACLLASTRLVGVHCPGLNSIYAQLTLTANAARDMVTQTGDLAYTISTVDTRFSKINLALEMPGLEGEIIAFFRPAPTAQPSYSEVATTVERDEFDGVRALVVGGSRGLGEIAAKLLAAGGAEVTLSYHSGAGDARRVADEITAGGGQVQIMQLDVTAETLPKLPDITLLVYMSSPFIFAARNGVFTSSLFNKFCTHYIDGFNRICTTVAKGRKLNVLYPSSVAVGTLPKNMGEYAAAKAASEILCRHLELNHKGLRIHTPRFDRMPTDQTANIIPVKSADPLPVVHAALNTSLGHDPGPQTPN